MVSVGDGDASLGEKIFHLAEAKGEAVGKPDGMADDFGWKAVTEVGGWFGIYRPCLPNPAQLEKADKTASVNPIFSLWLTISTLL